MQNHMESYYRSPSILLTNSQAEALRKLNLDSKSQPIPEQFARAKGVVVPSSGLKTGQQTVEQVQRPPSILLSSAVQDKQSNVGMRHNRMEMKYNNFVLVTKGEAI